ncbi:hypothetical protein Cantr_06370 [Candida viswanathii]|uniref:N-acetyltransferase SLI1 n=1 Tax=Candida viswanathii TaxID=5486 RepID=A0A367XVR6_9ASCO|nr:hypothetical protein Cantr_06370 [Candida viswanathii]
MTSDEPLVISRPLAVSEHFFRSRTAAKRYKSFQVTATYNNDLKDDLPLFYKALRKTLLEYHLFATNINLDKSINQYAFIPVESIKLKDVLTLEPERKEWLTNGVVNETYIKFCNNTSFELYCEKPLFKLILIGQRNLSAIFEHTIADGLVANYFHEIFLENLAYCDLKQDADFISEYGHLPQKVDMDTEVFNFQRDRAFIKNSLPPPIDPFLEDIDLDCSYGDPNFHEKVIPEGYPNKWPGRFDTVETDDIAFKLINFTPEEAKAILKKCKEHKVGLTSYIHVIHTLTLQPIFGDKHYTTHRVAMTLRRHFSPELAEPGYKKILSKPNYKILGSPAHMGYAQNLPPLKEFSWELVEKLNADILQDIKNKRSLHPMKKWKDTADIQHPTNDAFFNAQFGKPKADSVKISNLGFVNLPNYKVTDDKSWTITNMVFSQDLAPYASEFVLNIISTPLGGMNFVWSFFDYSFDDCEWDSFDGFVQQLHDNMIKYAK